MTRCRLHGFDLLVCLTQLVGCSGEGHSNGSATAGSGSGETVSPVGGTGGTNSSNAGTTSMIGTVAAQGGNATQPTGGTTGQTGGSSTTETATATGGSSATGGTKATTGGSSATGGTKATTGGSSTTLCTAFATPTKVGAIAASGLTELSGMVASRTNTGVLYAHADSGNTPVIYVMNESGASLGTITLTGAACTDWEDISIGIAASGSDYIYVADIGDNASRTGSGTKRTSLQVYRFLEPATSSLSTSAALSISSWEKTTLTYPSTTHDAETLFVDPLTQDILIVTKDTNGQSGVYRAPSTAFGNSAVLEQVATVTVGTSGNAALITAGDISPNADRVILRTYTAILLYPRLSSWVLTFAATPVPLPAATEQQSEGLTFNSDGTAWLSAGETSTAIYKGEASCP